MLVIMVELGQRARVHAVRLCFLCSPKFAKMRSAINLEKQVTWSPSTKQAGAHHSCSRQKHQTRHEIVQPLSSLCFRSSVFLSIPPARLMSTGRGNRKHIVGECEIVRLIPLEIVGTLCNVPQHPAIYWLLHTVLHTTISLSFLH